MSREEHVEELCRLLEKHGVPWSQRETVAIGLYDDGVRVRQPKWRIDQHRTNRRGRVTIDRLSGRFDTEVEARKYVAYLSAAVGHDEHITYEVHPET